MRKIKTISLFSGIGAYEKAAKKLNIPIEILHYCEINKFAATAFSAIHNVPEEKNLGDITSVDPTQLPKCDLVTYSFPCTSISCAGRREGIIKGKTKSGLVYYALDILEATQPKIAIMENVKNLVGKKFIKDFEQLLKILDEMGYNNYWKVLNSKDYNLPQNRTRVFLVSIKKEIDKGYEFPNTVPLTTKAIDLINKEDENVYWVNENSDRKVYEKLIEKGYNETEGVAKSPQTREYHKFKEIADCLLAHDSKTKNLVQFVNKDGQRVFRRMTPTESFKFMGFEEKDYLLAKKRLEEKYYNGKPRSDSQIYAMAGNSIAVNCIQAIMEELQKNNYL